jgi:peptidoglycan/LPS O-acetylase OafA/YrhL
MLLLSAVLIVSAPIFRLFFLFKGNPLAAMVLLPASWDTLFLGVVGAYFLNRSIPLARRALFGRLIVAGPLAFPILTAAVVIWPSLFNGLSASLLPTLVGIISLLFIAFAIHSPWRGFLSNRWLVGIGSISYGVYLFHEGIFGLLYAITHGGEPRTGEPRISSLLDVDVILLSLGVTFIVATFSFRYFERPLTQWARRFAYRREGS